jgi:hypothetical protein
MPTEAHVLAIDGVKDRAIRLCTGCDREKARDEFSPNPRAKDGLRSWCRRCERIAAYERYHEKGGREKAAAYHARPEVEARDRAYRTQHAERYNAGQVAYRRTPRGKLVSSRGTAISKLRRATTDRQRACLEARIALYDREIARLDRGFELPAEPPGRAATKRGRACAGPG